MIVAGFGCRAAATPDALRAALALAEAQGARADAFATVPGRLSLLEPLAADRGVPARAVEVAGIATPTTSARVLATHGTGSVAEAAALALAGPGARIVVPRITSPCGMATCALAESGDTP